MKRWAAIGIILSSVTSRYQLGFVLQGDEQKSLGSARPLAHDDVPFPALPQAAAMAKVPLAGTSWIPGWPAETDR